jgi:hypothetical protein
MISRYTTQLAAARATYDVLPRWDVGAQVSGLFGGSLQSTQYGVGAEVGYLAGKNIWLSLGYNFFGFRDRDLTAADYLDKGVYLRLRMKFDERLLRGLVPAASGE